MATTIDSRNGLEILDRDECVALLRRNTLGRIAVVAGDRPLVFPVNFAMSGDAIVLRTDTGTKLHFARDSRVAFECDGIDAVYHTGWSVLANGIAEIVESPGEVSELERLPLALWCAGPKPIWLRIRPTTLTGRRIAPHTEVRRELH
jgi:nitroimidazol reductase NimA-like FMN-containing flavoprotein (pyridoxamine 5'-phosphate oxidase superfamily)